MGYLADNVKWSVSVPSCPCVRTLHNSTTYVVGIVNGLLRLSEACPGLYLTLSPFLFHTSQLTHQSFPQNIEYRLYQDFTLIKLFLFIVRQWHGKQTDFNRNGTDHDTKQALYITQGHLTHSYIHKSIKCDIFKSHMRGALYFHLRLLCMIDLCENPECFSPG